MESGGWLKGRGVAFLVGLATIIILVRWLFTGTMTSAVAFATSEPVGGFKSGGEVFAQLAGDLICMVGTVVIALLTRVWDFLWGYIKARLELAAGQPSVVAQMPKALAAIQQLHSRLKALEAASVPKTPTEAARAATGGKTPAPKAQKKPAAAKPKAKAAPKKEDPANG